jgi:hypothetical protein
MTPCHAAINIVCLVQCCQWRTVAESQKSEIPADISRRGSRHPSQNWSSQKVKNPPPISSMNIGLVPLLEEQK